MLKINIKKYLINLSISIFIAIILLYSLYPILSNKFVYGDDSLFHMMRIEGIKDSIVNGNYLGLVYPNSVNSFGYGSGLFYPNFFLYIPALFNIIGINIDTSYKMFIVIITIACAVSMYFSTKYISKNKFISLCATIIYSLAQYRIYTFYCRSALGESIAFVFFPLIVCGIYDIFYNEFKKPWIIGAGFLGLMLCHSISLAIGLIIFFAVTIINIKKLIQNYKKFIKLVLTGCVVLLLSVFFWGPMLEQFISGKFGFYEPIYNVTDIAMELKSIFQLVGPGIGITFLMLLVLKFAVDSDKEKTSYSDVCLCIGLILVWATTKYFPWKVFEGILSPIQFPWRLFGFANAFLAVALAILIGKIERKRARIGIFIFLIVSSLIGSYYELERAMGSFTLEPLYRGNEYSSFSIGNGEWLPLGTKIEDLWSGENLVTLDDGSKIEADKKGGKVLFNYLAEYDCEHIDIPLIYYKGYKAYYTNKDGEKIYLPVNISYNNNQVRVGNLPDEDIEITVVYEGTIVQKISVYISIITIIFLFAFKIQKVVLRRQYLFNFN